MAHLILILIFLINSILKHVNADWEEIKNIRFTDCHLEKDVNELDGCKKLAKTRHAQFFYVSATDYDCNICYDIDDSNPTTSCPYKSFVYIPNSSDESGVEFQVDIKTHLNIKRHINYIVRVVIKSEIEKNIFARFYCIPDTLYLTITECDLKGFFTKSLEKMNFDYKEFNGKVQLKMDFWKFATEGTLFLLILKNLYVADYQPSIPGSSILNLVERMKYNFKIKLVSVTDKSNVKLLSLYVYGTTYYQNHNFKYNTEEYETRCVNTDHQQELLKNIPHTNIYLTKLRACISRTLKIRAFGIELCFDSFMHAFDTISADLLLFPNIDLIQIKDLFSLNTQVLKKIELPMLTESKLKVRESKRFFPEALSTCIYEQIAELLNEEQIQCIKAIEKSYGMVYVEKEIKLDNDIE